ncbi:MAG: glycosyltransferase [Candidatus Omnitrophota bacterium]
MKIAIVVEVFPALSETFILNQITGLIDLKQDVGIFAFNKLNELKRHEEIERYRLLDKVIYFNTPRKRSARVIKAAMIFFRYFLFYPKEISKCIFYKNFYSVRKILHNLRNLEPFLYRRYDIIHCHFGPVGNEFIFLKTIFSNIKFIVTFYGYDVRLGLQKSGDLYEYLFKNADRVISICDYHTQKLIDFGCNPDKITYHPLGLDVEKFKFEQRTKTKNIFTITTVARLEDDKNIFFALDVIKAWRDEAIYKFKYYLVGDGHLREDIVKKISEYKLAENVTLFGALSHTDVIKLLQETDVFFLSSKAEGLPTALLEAQAVGIPVIATDVGGVRDALIDGVTGFIIANNNIEDAKSRIIHLFKNPQVIKKMGEEGRKYVEAKFNIKILNRRLVGIYENLLLM